MWQIHSEGDEDVTVVKLQKLQIEQVDSPQNCIALDVAFLNQNTFGDVALRTEIIGLFRAQLNAVRTQLLLPVDVNGWNYLTHTLKGAAAAVGAQKFAVLADAWGLKPPPATQSARLEHEVQFRLALVEFNRIADGLCA
jgi:hypothetical protein